MNNALLKLHVNVQCLMAQDEGQDMVEYAMVAALVALGATAAMKGFATSLSTAFSTVGFTVISDAA